MFRDLRFTPTFPSDKLLSDDGAYEKLVLSGWPAFRPEKAPMASARSIVDKATRPAVTAAAVLKLPDLVIS